MIHTGGEFVLCLEGQVEYSIEDQKYLMEPGDSLIFAANLQHRWRNIGSGSARIVIVISCFEYGERASEFHIASQIQGEDISDQTLIDIIENMDLDD